MEVSKKVVFIKDWILKYVNSMPSKAESLSNRYLWRYRLICNKYLMCDDWTKNYCSNNADKTKERSK